MAYKYSYRIPKEELNSVEAVMRICFHDFGYAADENKNAVIRTDANPDEFRRIRGRAKCFRLYNETGDPYFTEEEESMGFFIGLYRHYFRDEGYHYTVKGYEEIDPL